MRQGAFIFAALGLLLGGTALLLWAMDGKLFTYALLAGAAAASLLTGLVVYATGGSAQGEVRVLQPASWPAAAVGIGAWLMTMGLVFGLYLVLIGAAIALAGAVGLVRETRATRRAGGAA